MEGNKPPSVLSKQFASPEFHLPVFWIPAIPAGMTDFLVRIPCRVGYGLGIYQSKKSPVEDQRLTGEEGLRDRAGRMVGGICHNPCTHGSTANAIIIK